MKIWMSEKAKKDNNYAARILWGIFGSVGVAVVLIMLMMPFASYMNLPVQAVSMWVWVIIMVALIWNANRIGKMANRDALIFCQDDHDNLFAVDIRWFTKAQGGLLDFVNMNVKTGEIQRKIKQEHILERSMEEGTLGKRASEVLSVEKIKVRTDGYMVVCKVRHPMSGVIKMRYVLQHGYDNESELILALERKRLSF